MKDRDQVAGKKTRWLRLGDFARDLGTSPYYYYCRINGGSTGNSNS